MKIAYVTMQYPVPSETFASLDIGALCDLGHTVSVRALRFPHSQYKKLIEERGGELEISHLSCLDFIYSVGFLFSNFRLFSKLIFNIFRCCWRSPRHLIKSLLLVPSVISVFRSVKKDNPDIVHLFWGHYPSMVGLLLKDCFPNLPLTMFLGAHDLVEAYPLSPVLAERSELVFTHTEANIPSLKLLGVKSEKIRVVHRGTKISEIPVLSPAERVQPERVTILTAARLIKEKGIDDVLDIMAGLAKLKSNFILYIAGDGPYKKVLERKVSELGLERNVTFLGHVPQNELLEKMADAEFFFLMSKYESERLPNVVKEAMYQRCAVVTTNTQGIQELVTHERDGFIVDMGDIETALNLVVMCLNNKELYESLCDEAHKKIVSNFDVRVSMSKYLALWSSIVRADV